MEIMMILGPYPFGLNTAAFQELNRNTEWRWPGQDVFEGVPALQFTGYGKETITLPGVIFPEYWGGTGQVDAMRALADQGQPQTLIDGRGNVLGEYVITGVQERQAIFAGAGVPLRQEFTVTLERYATGDAPAAVGGGTAGAQLAAATATTTELGILVAGAEASGGLAADSLTARLQQVQTAIGTGVTAVTGVINSLNQAISAARSIQTTAIVAKQTIAAIGEINSLGSAQAVVNGLLLTAGSAVQASTTSSRVIGEAVGALTAAGESAAAISIVRGAQIDVNRLAVASTRIGTQAEAFLGGFQ